MSKATPNEPPPAYGNTLAPNGPTGHPMQQSASRESMEESSISHDMRRSMEDEARDLPDGWIKQIDPQSGHLFFVDTRTNPPRSIWTHPYDDPQYLQSLPDTAPARQQQYQPPTSSPSKTHGKEGLGSKLMSKMTGTTKAERDAKREQRLRDEQQRVAMYQQRRQQMLEQQRMQQQMYGPPMGAYGRPQYGGGYGRRPGMGMGMPLAGGLMGGMLLGGMMGDMGDGGDYGGGGFDGGDGGGGGGGE